MRIVDPSSARISTQYPCTARLPYLAGTVGYRKMESQGRGMIRILRLPADRTQSSFRTACCSHIFLCHSESEHSPTTHRARYLRDGDPTSARRWQCKRTFSLFSALRFRSSLTRGDCSSSGRSAAVTIYTARMDAQAASSIATSRCPQR
eukprot:scaffold996_cov409-Prasinococcus_capsulatus_cf.AAC.19